MDGSSAVSVTLGLLMIDGNDISCMCVDVGHCVIQSLWLLSILIILQAVNTRDGSFSLSLDKLSGVAPHHQACPRCLSVLLIASLRPPPPPPQYVPHFRHQSINQSVHQSIILERDSMQHVSLSLLNEGIVVSERERERERERENVVVLVLVLVLLHPESVRVCYGTANSLSQS